MIIVEVVTIKHAPSVVIRYMPSGDDVSVEGKASPEHREYKSAAFDTCQEETSALKEVHPRIIERKSV
eukprot:CAMPEP_0194039646 /NCGR_PEP_ID=MMETSP0009_2-20130614/11760_1 /TAXON_ID=210454 /ORGANISM="Grammatophora oceanica, Strain CCMP 410" /LENGTH=67 /DNA_ID=CAMNT_0038682553 /DNA_START=100 /DNA_END=303 /DNA_ORIENTATION=+